MKDTEKQLNAIVRSEFDAWNDNLGDLVTTNDLADLADGKSIYYILYGFVNLGWYVEALIYLVELLENDKPELTNIMRPYMVALCL